MNDIGPGDLVECLDAAGRNGWPPTPLVVGAVYTVARALLDPEDFTPILVLTDWGLHAGRFRHDGWAVDRFRPIRRSSEKFMRELMTPVDLEGVLA